MNLEICNAYNRAFFDVFLKGALASALEVLAPKYPGVRFGIAP